MGCSAPLLLPRPPLASPPALTAGAAGGGGGGTVLVPGGLAAWARVLGMSAKYLIITTHIMIGILHDSNVIHQNIIIMVSLESHTNHMK